jgi:hypothetical protein
LAGVREQAGPEMNRFEPRAKACFLGWSERRWLVVFCAVAAARVFVLSAAFPFFNNVDEQEHFDLVLRYSRGNVPRMISPLAPESTRYIALAGSPEYRLKPEQFPGGTIPLPLWRQPVEKLQPLLERRASVLASAPNHETQSPPLYYALAGMWMKLGRLCGMDTVFLLYWIRFLNVLVMVGVVWLTSVATRQCFRRRRSCASWRRRWPRFFHKWRFMEFRMMFCRRCVAGWRLCALQCGSGSVS